MYFSAYDHREFPEPVSFAANYRELLNGGAVAPAMANKKSGVPANPITAGVIAKSLGFASMKAVAPTLAKGGKVLGLILVGALAAFVSTLRRKRTPLTNQATGTGR